MTVSVKTLRGADIAPYLDDLAALRIAVFRDWPYLYEGSMEYERDYLRPYLDDPTAVVIGAFDGQSLVGAATASALARHKADFADAFQGQPEDLNEIYYLAESVLLPAYRGRGLGHAFFDGREAAARTGGFRHTAFCAVIRREDHAARPSDYWPLDGFWRKRGYAPRDGVLATFRWRDVGAPAETSKQLQFWAKTLGVAGAKLSQKAKQTR